VLEQSVQRNRDLATVADSAIARGRACERSYDALSKGSSSSSP
jgi:hypothetical protein